MRFQSASHRVSRAILGVDRALRLQAQLMLVQTKIEENTRPKEATAWVPQPSRDTRAGAHRISDVFG